MYRFNVICDFLTSDSMKKGPEFIQPSHSKLYITVRAKTTLPLVTMEYNFDFSSGFAGDGQTWDFVISNPYIPVKNTLG